MVGGGDVGCVWGGSCVFVIFVVEFKGIFDIIERKFSSYVFVNNK